MVARAHAAPTPSEPSDTSPQLTEVHIVPVVGGNSDIGLGGGFIGSITRRDDVQPYVWRVELGSFTTFKTKEDGGGLRVPFTDHYALLTIPQLIPDRVRLELRPAFTLQQLLYSGMGNASPPPVRAPNGSLARYLYQWTHPSLLLDTRIKLPVENLTFLSGVLATYDYVAIPSDSFLATDIVKPNLAERPAVAASPYGVVLLRAGIMYDTRDDEIEPRSGQWHQLRAYASPAIGKILPFGYEQLDFILRGYVTPIPNLTLAGRFVADAIFGNAPFYELSRYEETNAIGGTIGVRGVPAQRYYGKIKLFGNLEQRTDVVKFPLFGKTITAGFVTFFDAGRVWFNFHSHPDLDGTGLGLHWGAGGGLRFLLGKTLVLRGDIAYSPDAYPISAYFQANHIF
jgi:hypothetical protein